MNYHNTNITDEQTKYFAHSYPISKWYGLKLNGGTLAPQSEYLNMTMKYYDFQKITV